MTRKCSCCHEVGHNVSSCNDHQATIYMNQLLQETSAPAAMEKIRGMTAGIISFVLSRGFGVPISGKRAKLIELVLARYPASDVLESRELIARREAEAEARAEQRRVASQARIIAQQERRNVERERVNALLLEQDEIGEMYDNLQQRFNTLALIVNNPFSYYDVVSLLPSHPSYGIDNVNVLNTRHTVDIMTRFVKMLLTTIHRLETDRASNMIESLRQHEINMRINAKLNRVEWVESALRSAADSCRVQFTQAGIVHMTRMAKMYNYRRMLHADQTQYDYSHVYAQPVYAHQAHAYVQPVMKPLQICVVVKNLKDNEGQSCGICFDDLPALKAVITGCKHTFCSDCIGKFAQTRGIKSFINCPHCRSEIAELSVSCQTEHDAVVAGLAPVPN